MTAAGATVRVWVPDVWEVVSLLSDPAATIADIKAEALQKTLGNPPRVDPATYIVKYRGALVTDEQTTLGAMNLPDRAPLIVLPARRRPVT